MNQLQINWFSKQPNLNESIYNCIMQREECDSSCPHGEYPLDIIIGSLKDEENINFKIEIEFIDTAIKECIHAFETIYSQFSYILDKSQFDIPVCDINKHAIYNLCSIVEAAPRVEFHRYILKIFNILSELIFIYKVSIDESVQQMICNAMLCYKQDLKSLNNWHKFFYSPKTIYDGFRGLLDIKAFDLKDTSENNIQSYMRYAFLERDAGTAGVLLDYMVKVHKSDAIGVEVLVDIAKKQPEKWETIKSGLSNYNKVLIFKVEKQTDDSETLK